MNFRLSAYFIVCLLGLLLVACQNTGQNGASLPTDAQDQLRLATKTPQYERLPQQTTTIKGEGFVKTKGKSLLYVPKGAIMDSAGKTYEGTFEVKVREALTMNDFVQSGLNTLSDKGILESGGMMQILVEDTAGKALTINPERGLRLSMPVNTPTQAVNPFRKVALKKEQDTLRKGWQLFYGAKDENGKMIWKETEQPKQEVSAKEYFNLQNQLKVREQMERFVGYVELALNDTVLNKYRSKDELKYRRFYYKDRLYPILNDDTQSHETSDFYGDEKPFSGFFDESLLALMDQQELPQSKSGKTQDYLNIIPSVSYDKNIFATVSAKQIEIKHGNNSYWREMYVQYLSNDFVCNNTLPIITSINHDLYSVNPHLTPINRKESKVDTLWLLNITNSYNRIKKLYLKLKDDQTFQEKLNAFEKEISNTARLEAVISQTGWYNCDRYTQKERFAGTFEVEGCNPELEPYLRLAWVQPDLNISIQPNLKQFPNYEFTGVKKSGGVLIAWIPGLMAGSLTLQPEQVQQGQANNPIPVGKIVLQPADDKKINALIEQLSLPVAMAERPRARAR